MGGSTQKTNQTQNTAQQYNSQNTATNTSSSTPNVPTWLQTPAMQFATNIGTLQNQPVNPLTQTPLMTQAAQAASDLTNPQYGVAKSTLTNLPDVQAQSVLTNLQDYINPQEADVINPVMQQYDYNAGVTQANQAAAAAKNNAFGGSRYGIQEAQTAQDLAMGRAQTQGGLLNQAYTQAAGMSAQDAANRQAAQTTNQQADLQKASELASIRTQQANEALANQQAQQNAGQTQLQNQIMMQDYPAAYQAQLEGLLSGLNPAMYTGQSNTSTMSNASSGTSAGQSNTNSTTTTDQGLGGWLGNMMMMMASTGAKAAAA